MGWPLVEDFFAASLRSFELSWTVLNYLTQEIIQHPMIQMIPKNPTYIQETLV